MAVTFKQKLGCWLNERWKTELILRAPAVAKMIGMSWLDLCNRNERLSIDNQSSGRICHWKDSSRLTVARLFPSVGQRILERAFQEWPFRFATQAEILSKKMPTNPEISIIMVVRGTGRLPQFQAALASLLAQEGCETEIIVVEQSPTKEFNTLIPPCVKYIHTPTTVPFNRSWGLNVGAQNSSGKHIVLYDADMVMPACGAASITHLLNHGIDAVQLARYLFYLNRDTSERLQCNRSHQTNMKIDYIVQNNKTPVAISREAYLRIGGHDESFFRWGGEDIEFMSRLQTLNLAKGSYLPILHLWHESAENKTGDRNIPHMESRLSIPAVDRIEEMSQLPFGQMAPTSLWNQ